MQRSGDALPRSMRVIEMEFKAVIKQSEGWWIGWLVDMPGVNAQERTREKLIESLKLCAEDMMKTPYTPEQQEELVTISL